MPLVFEESLLETEYFRKYALGKEKTQGTVCFNPYRNFDVLCSLFNHISQYNLRHARSFAKRIKTQDNDWTSCEAVFTELIVYGYYLRLRNEGLVRSINIEESEADVIVERSDQTHMHLEAMCVMPSFPESQDGKPVVYSVKTHTQDAPSSIRQKLLRKIEKQGQMSKPRENFVVVELNDTSIVGDFHVLSSLSDGYKVSGCREPGKILRSGYDWSKTFLAWPQARYLKGIIWFDRGDYEARRVLINPYFQISNTE